jgi:hypothetical protein
MTQSVYDAFVGTALQESYYQYWKEKAYDSAATSSNAFPWTQLGYRFSGATERLSPISRG